MESRSILIKIRSVYGNEAYYPVCNDAKSFASIAGTTTLTLATLRSIVKLGYQIGVEYAPGVIAPFQGY